MKYMLFGILMLLAGLQWHSNTYYGNTPGTFDFFGSAVLAGIGGFLVVIGIAKIAIDD